MRIGVSIGKNDDEPANGLRNLARSVTIWTMAIQWDEVRDARTIAGLTQSELGARMGVSPRSVRNYETPGATIPRKAEHAVRRVLGAELAALKQLRESGDYVQPTDSNVVPFARRDRLALNPRLRGITNSEMLREMLARDEIANADLAARGADEDSVGGRTEDEEIALDAAATTDDTTPSEFD